LTVVLSETKDPDSSAAASRPARSAPPRPDGTLKAELYAQDAIHLSPAGYALYAQRLQPLLAPAGMK
jgi:lysophospholipase L1-like esterase